MRVGARGDLRPGVPIIRVPDDIEEVIRISNSTAYGLSSACAPTGSTTSPNSSPNWKSAGQYREVPGYRMEISPFGGIKDSGLGYKEGVVEAMKSFTNVRTWSLPWS